MNEKTLGVLAVAVFGGGIAFFTYAVIVNLPRALAALAAIPQ